MDIALLLLFVGSMFLAGRVAEHRGRSLKAWIWIAAVIGPFALPALWLLPNRHAADGDSSQGPKPGAGRVGKTQRAHHDDSRDASWWARHNSAFAHPTS